MHRTVPSSLSITMAPSAEEGVAAGGNSTRSVRLSINPSASGASKVHGCFVDNFDFCPIKVGEYIS